MPEPAKMRKPDVKVVILGDMNVGKTSLLHRYTERKFKDTISTVGGAFFLKQWGPYNISIWDTAGKPRLLTSTNKLVEKKNWRVTFHISSIFVFYAICFVVISLPVE